MSEKEYKPAERLNAVTEYVFSRLAKEVKDVEHKNGRKVLDLGIGTPDIPPSKSYREKLAEFVNQPQAHMYPGYGATSDFKAAMISWYKERFGMELKTDELYPLNGAKDGIAHVPLALLNENDEILVPNPGYPSFSTPATLIGAKVITYDLIKKNNFKIDFAELGKKVNKNTRFIWVNFPSNPTGQVATLEELEEIINFARQHKIFVIYDAAYSEITFDGFRAPSILQVEGAKDWAAEIGSFSKSFSFAGYRMGWIVGNSSIIASVAKLKSQMDSGLSLPLQSLGAYALTNQDKEWSSSMIRSYKQRRDVISDSLKSLGLTFDLPKGSLYIWAEIPNGEPDSEEYCLRLLRERHIFVAPGSAFGSNGNRYVRVSICANIDNIEEYFKT